MMFLLGWSLKVSVILGCALVLVRLLGRQSSALRHWVLSTAIIVAALAPALSVVLPEFKVTLQTRIPSLIADLSPTPVSLATSEARNDSTAFSPPSVSTNDFQQQYAASAPPLAMRLEQNKESTGSTPVAASLRPADSGHFRNLRVILESVWLSGVLLGFMALIGGVARLAWVAYKSERVMDDRWHAVAGRISREYRLKRTSRLLRSAQPSLLATWGVVWPEILLPSNSSDWPEELINVVLSHELAHVQRGDWAIQILSQTMRAFHWFNPLVWIVCDRLNHESEHACDDAVLNRGVTGADYAAHLLRLARTFNESGRVWTPALMMARDSTFKRRFRAMLNPGLNRSALTRVAVVVTSTVLLAVTLPVVALRVAGQSVHGLTNAIRQVAVGQSPGINLQNVISAVSQAPGVVASQAARGTPPSQIPGVPMSTNSSLGGVVIRLGTNDAIAGVDVELTRIEGTSTSPLLPPAYPPGNFSRGAAVRANAPNPGDTFNSRTGVDGQFLFSNLKPGTYQLRTAQFGGAYYPAEYGQRDPHGRGHAFPVLEGQSIAGVKIEMAPTGSISGHVTDTGGVPAARVRVMVLEASYESGFRVLSLIQAQDTNDRGDYRLFWLAPGQYFIAARPEDLRAQSLSMAITPPGGASSLRESFSAAPITPRSIGPGEIIEETYQLSYYGSGTDPQRATPVDLRPGSNLSGIDLFIGAGRVPARRIRGVVMDGTTGKPAAGVSVHAYPRELGPSDIQPQVTADANGAFEIAGLLPNAYNIRANSADYTLRGSVPIEASTANITNITIVLSTGFPLAGRVHISGRQEIPAGFDFSQIRVNLGPGLCCGTPSSTGTFTLNDVRPGKYTVGVGPILTAVQPIMNVDTLPGGTPPAMQDAYVKSVEFGGLDVLTNGISIPGPTSQELNIVIDVNGGTVEGRTVDMRQQPVASAIVVLVPNLAGRNRKDLYRSATTDSSGHFKFRAIPPGDYKFLAWDYVETGIWFEPEFMRNYEGRGISIRVVGGSNPSFDVPVIPR